MDARTHPKDSAIAMATCWMSVAFVAAVEFQKENAIATEIASTNVDCAEAMEFQKENAIAMGTLWMSAVYVEAMAARSMHAGCVEETTHLALVALTNLLATMTRLRPFLMLVCVNLERVEVALSLQRATTIQRS